MHVAEAQALATQALGLVSELEVQALVSDVMRSRFGPELGDVS